MEDRFKNLEHRVRVLEYILYGKEEEKSKSSLASIPWVTPTTLDDIREKRILQELKEQRCKLGDKGKFISMVIDRYPSLHDRVIELIESVEEEISKNKKTTEEL